MSLLDELDAEIAKAGGPQPIKSPWGDTWGAIEQFVNGCAPSAPWASIILRYAPRMGPKDYLDLVIRALAVKGLTQATPFLLSLFDREPLLPVHVYEDACLALKNIDDKTAYPRLLRIARDTRLGRGRGRGWVVGVLYRLKSEEAFQTLVTLLDDPDVCAEALSSLGMFGDPRAIPIIEKATVKKGLYEYKAKETALRRLKRKAAKSK